MLPPQRRLEAGAPARHQLYSGSVRPGPLAPVVPVAFPPPGRVYCLAFYPLPRQVGPVRSVADPACHGVHLEVSQGARPDSWHLRRRLGPRIARGFELLGEPSSRLQLVTRSVPIEGTVTAGGRGAENVGRFQVAPAGGSPTSCRFAKPSAWPAPSRPSVGGVSGRSATYPAG